MRKNPHVRICGGLGSATTLVYPTAISRPGPGAPHQATVGGRVGWAAATASHVAHRLAWAGKPGGPPP